MPKYQRAVQLSRRRQQVRRALRKALRWAAILAVVAAIVAADRLGVFGRRPQNDYARYHGNNFRVVYVVDGDTLDVDAPDGRRDRTRVRLWGVDTPETKHPRKPVQHFGPEAEEFARRLCDGRRVTLQLVRGRTRGTRGRLLAYVILTDGTMLNRELVRLGYGYADPRYEHPYLREFRSLQHEARKARRGLWENARQGDLPHYYQDTLKLGDGRQYPGGDG